MGLRRTLVFILSALGSHQRHDVTCLVLGMGVGWGANKSRKMRGVVLVHTRCVAQTKVGVVKLERRDIF